MPEMDERRPERPAGEFARLVEFAQRGSVLASAQQIRVHGLRRLRRRRACQGVLGTGALAVVVFLGAGFVQNGSGHASSRLGPGAGAGGTVGVSRPAAGRAPSADASSPPVRYQFPSSVAASSASAVEAQLQRAGYTEIQLRPVASNTVASGNAIDIEDTRGASLLGRVVIVGTPLVLLVSTGPSGH